MSTTRRAFLATSAATVGGAVAVGRAAPAVSLPAGPRPPGASDLNAERAVATYAAMQRYFYLPTQRLYRETYPYTTGNAFSFVWPYSQAFAATNYLAMVPGVGARYRRDVPDRISGLRSYYSRTGLAPNAAVTPNRPSPPGYDAYVNAPLGGGGDKYYDDNGWLGLDFLQWHAISGDRAMITAAQGIFGLLVAGWDGDPTHPRPGGIFWTQGSWAPSRSVMENAQCTQIGVHLYRLTRQRRYLDWARRTYDWVRRELLAPEGLYWDSVGLDGKMYPDFWSYNQGLMVGAGTLLSGATGDRGYLRQAEATARTALDFYGTDDRLMGQPDYFNSIMFKNMLQLAALNHDPRYRRAMQSYADTVWSTKRDAATGLFHFTDQPVLLLEQAAMVQIHALLAGHNPDLHLI